MSNSAGSVTRELLSRLPIPAGIVTGAYLEVVSGSMATAVCAGTLIALSTASDRRMRTTIVITSFGALFLLILGGSMLAAHCRSDVILHFRTGLIDAGDLMTLGAGLLYVSFLMRMAIIPLLSASNGARGWMVGIGPSWLSAWILNVRLTGTLPHDMVADISVFIESVTVVSLIVLGISVLKNRSESRWVVQIASGTGIIALFFTWIGPFHYQTVFELLIRTSLISLGIILMAPLTHTVFSAGRILFKLGLAGFPLFILHDLRKMLYLTVDGLGLNIGYITLWLVPLMALFRGLEWQESRTENRLSSSIIGSVAFGLGIIVLFFAVPDTGSLWSFIHGCSR